ncbi:hypothetical protein [Brevibacterium paucivorans]|uniref:GAP1-N2 domain-containing protein n=1 Tax=Brevibacterium paucivorans TaxID=170994 RepID=UPI00321A057B
MSQGQTGGPPTFGHRAGRTIPQDRTPSAPTARITVPNSDSPATTSGTVTPTPAPRDTPQRPATRWAQLTYASFDRADGSPGGWQEKDIVGEPTDDERRTLRRYVMSQFSYHGTLPKFATPEQVAALPVRLAYHAPESDRPGIYAYAANAGADSTGRPGNVYSHILMDRDPDTMRPIDLWRSPSFARPASVDDILHTQIADKPQSMQAGNLNMIAKVLQTPGYTEPILAAADALMNAPDTGVVVLVSDRQDWSAIVIMAVQYLMSPSLARTVNWSVYERARELKGSMQIVAVPECDREDVQRMDHAYVICDGDIPRIEGERHVLNQGRPIPVTAFSTLIRACIAQSQELAGRLEALTKMDQWAPVQPHENVQPVWSLAALLVKEPGSLDRGIVDRALDVASQSFPASARHIDTLFARVSQDVVARVNGSSDPWAVVDEYPHDANSAERIVAQRAALMATLEGRANVPRPAQLVCAPELAKDAEVVASAVSRVEQELGRVTESSFAVAEMLCVAGIADFDANPQLSERLITLIAQLPQSAPRYSHPVELDARATGGFIHALLENEQAHTPETQAHPAPTSAGVPSNPAPTSAVPPKPAAPPPTTPARPSTPPPVPPARSPQPASQWAPPGERGVQQHDTGSTATQDGALRTRSASETLAVSEPLARALVSNGLPKQVQKRAHDDAFTPLVAQLTALSLREHPQLAVPLTRYVRNLPAQPSWVARHIVTLPAEVAVECSHVAPHLFDTDAVLALINAHAWSPELKTVCEQLAAGSSLSRRVWYPRLLLDAYEQPRELDSSTLLAVTYNLGDWKRHHRQALSSYLYAYQLASTVFPDTYSVNNAPVQSVNVDDIDAASVDPERVRRSLTNAHPDIEPEDLVVLAMTDRSVRDAMPSATVGVVDLVQGSRRIIYTVCEPFAHDVHAEDVLDCAKDFVTDRGGKLSMFGMGSDIKNTLKSLHRQEDTR